MTIIVYDPKLDACFADRLHTLGGSMRTQYVDHTKVVTTPAGHLFASTGSGSESIHSRAIDSCLQSFDQGVVATMDYEKADDCSIIVRHNDGRVFLSTHHADGKLILYPATDWGYPGIPWSRGAGGTFFDAYFQEHRDTVKALELTCAHAYACGFGSDRF